MSVEQQIEGLTGPGSVRAALRLLAAELDKALDRIAELEAVVPPAGHVDPEQAQVVPASQGGS